MFIEPNISGERRGFIEVICGSMFSGKTEELITPVEAGAHRQPEGGDLQAKGRYTLSRNRYRFA